MNFSDLIIIYLACGAPFAVQRFLSRPSGRPVAILSAVAISFLCWPANAIAAIWGWFSIGKSNGRTETRKTDKLQLDRVQVELEKFIFSGFETISIFEFRDIFFRYAGLAAESRQSDAGVFTAEIFEISVAVGTWMAMGRITMIMDVAVSCPLVLSLDEPVTVT